MNEETILRLKAAVRDVVDFPKPGIVFKDIAPLLEDAEMLRLAVDGFAEACQETGVDKVAGIDARGFIFAAAVAYKLGVGLVLVRKRGKLPFKSLRKKYALEYGEAEVELHVDAVKPGERVVVMDDLLATGGTAAAAAGLIREAGGVVAEVQFLIELEFLGGRRALEGVPVRSFLKY